MTCYKLSILLGVSVAQLFRRFVPFYRRFVPFYHRRLALQVPPPRQLAPYVSVRAHKLLQEAVEERRGHCCCCCWCHAAAGGAAAGVAWTGRGLNVETVGGGSCFLAEMAGVHETREQQQGVPIGGVAVGPVAL